MLWDFVDPQYIEVPDYRGIIFRRSFPRLRELIDRSLKWFHGIADWQKGDRCWVFPSGAKLYFGHCLYEESKYDYQGHEYQYMGFDQLEEFTESQYDFLKVQARTSNPKLKVRIRSTGNPGGVGHLWVKRTFIDNKVPMQIYKNHLDLTSIFIPAKIYDNPSLIDNDPTYVKRLENLPEKERRALLEGDWNVFSGQYFREWIPSQHIVEPHYIPNHCIKFIGGDYGFKSPSSIGWYAIDADGNVTRYKEIYKEGLHYDTLAQMLLDMSEGEDIRYAVFDPSIFGDKQHHKEAKEGKSGAEIMQEIIGDKFPIMRGDNRRLEGWANVRQYLKDDRFKVFSTCTAFIKTFPANIHDEKRPEDLDTNGEDHSADETRYSLASLRLDEKAEINFTVTADYWSPWAVMERNKKAREKHFKYQARR